MNWVIIALVAIGAATAVAAIMRQGNQKLISTEQLQKLMGQDDSILLLDVRTPREFNSGHIPGAVLFPYDNLLSAPGEIPRQGEGIIIVYCERGSRARLSQKALIKSGFSNVLHLKGDMWVWRAQGLPIEMTMSERQ